jgi:hypothetical protein
MWTAVAAVAVAQVAKALIKLAVSQVKMAVMAFHRP